MVDRTRARYRTARAKVLSITGCGDETKLYKEVRSDFDSNFIYQVGKEVVSQKLQDSTYVAFYEIEKSMIIAPGIHYFFTKDLAIDYHPFTFTRLNHSPPYPNATRVCKFWSDNGGVLESVRSFQNGLLHGEATDYENGGKIWECLFRDGKRDGAELCWDSSNGDLIFHYIFENGQKVDEIQDIYSKKED